jgi:hypothetical protein
MMADLRADSMADSKVVRWDELMVDMKGDQMVA